MKKKNAALWLICFALLLLLPQAVWLTAADRFETDATENTAAATAPKLTKDSYRSFASSYENYFNSNVPFRSQLITFNSLVELKLFQERSINDKVVVGDNDWLFYSAESDIDDYKGTNLFTQTQLELIADNLMISKSYLDDRDIEFVLFIAPNKETIYGEEYLPSYYRKGELTRVDQLVTYLQENTDIRIVYPVEEMLAHKNDWSLYWHYDTHWNAAGGYIGARALLRELGIEVPAPEDVTFTLDDFSGYDLARMMNLQPYYEENKPKDINYIVTGYNSGNNLQAVSIDDATALVYHADSPDTRRLFMVRDSFGGGMAPALVSSFQDSYLAHWNGFFEQSMIDEQAPDIFVLELVERRLDYLNVFRLSE